MEEIQDFKDLLTQVRAISKKYENIARITGENYNIFNILGLSTKEVRTHSAFIADLLDPNGLHGKGDVFLELFIEQVEETLNESKKEYIDKFKTDDARVIVEESIGEIEGDTGGRIDIVVKDNNRQIVIENKIYAGDQFKQLVRYSKEYPDAVLLYLTLYAKDASEYSVKKEDGTILKRGKDYFNITYEKYILNWLKECHKETANLPILRETLTQYIYLIKQLTGQTMSDDMNKEIAQLIIESNNFETAFDIEKTILKVKEILFHQIEAALVDLNFENTDKINNDKEDAFIKLKNGYELIVAFKDNYDYLIIGIKPPDEGITDDEYGKDLEKILKSLISGEYQEWKECGCLIARPRDYSRWNIAKPWMKVKDGSFKTYMKGIVDGFKDYIEN